MSSTRSLLYSATRLTVSTQRHVSWHSPGKDEHDQTVILSRRVYHSIHFIASHVSELMKIIMRIKL